MSLAFIIVFDLTNPESFNNIQKLIQEVQKISDSPTIIIVGNKSDLKSERKISYEDVFEFFQQLNLQYN